MEIYSRLGFLYEALFNVGILKGLKEKFNYYPSWVEKFSKFSFNDYWKQLYFPYNPTELLNKALSRVGMLYYLQGYTFFKFLWKDLANFNLSPFFYYGKPAVVEDEFTFFKERFDEKFDQLPPEFLSEQKGNLPHIDLLLHFRKGKAHYIVVSDLSLYGAQELYGFYEEFNIPATFPSGLAQLAQFDTYAVRRGYLFKPIHIKGVSNLQKVLDHLLELKSKDPEEFKNLYTLLEAKNRELAKLLQACSYTADYLKLLLQKGIIDDSDPLVVRIFGITLYKTAQLTFKYPVSLHNIVAFLEKAKEVYSYSGERGNLDLFMEKFRDKLQEVLKEQNPKVGVSVRHRKWNSWKSVYSERWEIGKDFRLNDEKRKRHAEVLGKVLKKKLYVADLGVPGIGKTTTIFRTFQRNGLIIYTSPRTVLNLDLIKRWCSENPNMVAFYAQSEFDNTIYYYTKDDTFTLPRELYVPKVGKVKLIKIGEDIEEESYQSIVHLAYDLTANNPTYAKGVLNRVLKTVAYLLEMDDRPLKGREVVVSFATQAIIKHFKSGQSTFEHLKKFLIGEFKNPAFGGEKLRELLKKRFLSNGIEHIIFVVDEITGSDTGRPLLKKFLESDWFEQFDNFSKQNGLPLRVHLAVLDASLKGFDVFKTFAEDREDKPVVYTSLTDPQGETKEDIPVEEVKVLKKTFTCIDAFGFPSAEVDTIYDFRSYKNKEEEEIVLNLLKSYLANGKKQIFLFWQDKKKLEKLKAKLLSGQILKEEEVLIIHSESSREEDFNKERVKLILATSSAARGLTFPLIDTYLVVVPTFLVENNLTELVQVLFRGRSSLKRGGKKISLEEGKRTLHFLFLYGAGEGELYRFARALEIANLIKASLLTVTCGGAIINTKDGNKILKIVPVGLQKERTFYPLKELEKRILEPKKVLAQLVKKGNQIGQLAFFTLQKLQELQQKARVIYHLPPEELQKVLKMLEQFEKSDTLEELLNINLPIFRSGEILTVKGHFLILSTALVRTTIKLPKEERKDLVKLLGILIKKEPLVGKKLVPLREYLLKGENLHTDLNPSESRRVLIVPPLAWPYDNFDPNRDSNLNWSSLIRDFIFAFLESAGNLHSLEEGRMERPFGIGDIDAELFDEVGSATESGANVVMSRELNLFEFLISP